MAIIVPQKPAESMRNPFKTSLNQGEIKQNRAKSMVNGWKTGLGRAAGALQRATGAGKAKGAADAAAALRPGGVDACGPEAQRGISTYKRTHTYIYM